LGWEIANILLLICLFSSGSRLRTCSTTVLESPGGAEKHQQKGGCDSDIAGCSEEPASSRFEILIFSVLEKSINLMRLADYSLVENWPTTLRKLGAISAVALDVYKNVVVFHRDDRVWNAATFDLTTNVFQKQNLGPIADNTIVTFDRVTGNVVTEWGKDMFYMPHGLHINGNYYYVTDVGELVESLGRSNIQ
jgi:hypothetical protein